MSGTDEQAVARAHLRDLPPCRVCGKTATVEMFNGVNAPMGVFCRTHGEKALAKFKGEQP